MPLVENRHLKSPCIYHCLQLLYLVDLVHQISSLSTWRMAYCGGLDVMDLMTIESNVVDSRS